MGSLIKSIFKSKKQVFSPGTKVVKNRIRDGYTPAKIVATVVFTIYSVTLLACLVWALAMSLKDYKEYILDQVSFPKQLMFVNYLNAFVELTTGGNNMFVMFFNSLWYAGGNTILALGVCTVTAYVIAKYQFTLGKIVWWMAMITMIVPIVNNLPSQFMLARILHTYDSPLTLIASLGGINFTTLLLCSFFKNIDHGYAEAAYIDGASHLQIFVKIMLPFAIPTVGALALTNFTVLWNDSEGPFIFLPSYPTLASGLYVYQLEMTRNLNYPVMFAGLLMSAIPILILWIVFNKHILTLQFGGGLKG